MVNYPVTSSMQMGEKRRTWHPEGLASCAASCGVEVGGPRGRAGTETFTFEVALALFLSTSV